MLPQWCRDQMRTSEALDALAHYILTITETGDWLNDYAADIPECGQHLVLAAGQLLALAFGV